VAFSADLARIVEAAASFAGPDERMTGILAAELLDGNRVYVAAFEAESGRTWLALDDAGSPVTERRRVHEAVSLAALCEVVEEAAGVERLEPRPASAAYLDELGSKLGAGAAGAVEQAFPSVEELAAQVVARHKTPLT
jgi:hypothetical protein